MAYSMKLARRPGEKESRFAHLLSGIPEPPEQHVPASSSQVAPAPRVPRQTEAPQHLSPADERILRLESELADLRRQFEEFRRKFE